MSQPSTNTLALGVVGHVVATMATFVLAAVLLLIEADDCTDGDGGYPFVAETSARGRLCRAGYGLVEWSTPLSWLVITLMGTLMLVRWARGEVPGMLVTVSVLLGAAVPWGIYTFEMSRSPFCTAEQEVTNARLMHRETPAQRRLNYQHLRCDTY